MVRSGGRLPARLMALFKILSGYMEQDRSIASPGFNSRAW